MKKLFVSSLAMAIVGLALCTIFNAPVAHNHAEAASQWVYWQCQRCGQRVQLRSGALPSQYGCGPKRDRHIWSRM
ncbi:MAG: hypothetical protein IJ601_03360 [Acidaminococcaceae bacterium]|nr:hypothetical protein [Acidaminococcaceae bacterium]